MDLHEIKNNYPLGFEKFTQQLEDIGSVTLCIDNDTDISSFTQKTQETKSKTTLYRNDKRISETLKGKLHCDDALVFQCDSYSAIINALNNNILEPMLLGNSTSSFGKNISTKAKKINHSGKVGVIIKKVVSNCISVSIQIKKELLIECYFSSLEVSKNKEQEIKRMFYREYIFKIVILNSAIDKSKYKNIDLFWRQTKQDIKSILKQKQKQKQKQKKIGSIIWLDQKSPASSITIEMDESKISDNFNHLCELLKSINLPKESWIETCDFPKDFKIRDIY